MALPNSPDAPQPLGRVVMAMKEWVGRLGEVWVDAQVIEIRRRSGPTQFLTLRDRVADISVTATVSAMILDAAGPIPEGSRISARVKPRVFERNTSLSLECLELRVAGEGRLLAQLEQLKRKLQAEGLFDAHRKQRLPFLPRTIGLVTAKNSDAERDVLTNVEARWAVPFRVEHAVVQGPSAAESVMLAIKKLDADQDVDVIIIARGGGSLEDLLPFSDEGLIRVVAACRTPVISAIGHEQDTPLLDWVADVRASTPTGSASLVVPDLRQELQVVTQARSRLTAALAAKVDGFQRHLDDLRSRPVLRDPTHSFDAHYQRLELMRHKLDAGITNALNREESRLTSMLSTIRATSPKATLERGYAVLVADDNTSVSSVEDVDAGETITAWLAVGQLTLTVEDPNG